MFLKEYSDRWPSCHFLLFSEEFLGLPRRLGGLKYDRSRKDSGRVYDGHIMADSSVLASSVMFCGMFMQRSLIPLQTMYISLSLVSILSVDTFAFDAFSKGYLEY